MQIGNPIFQGDVIFAAADASATIGLTDGTDIYLADSSAVEINDEVHGLAQTPAEGVSAQEFLAEGVADLGAICLVALTLIL